jgi:hypothetical protein
MTDVALEGTEMLALPDGLAAFAAANGWRYDATADPPALGASLWEWASNGTVHDRVSGPGWEAGRITGGTREATSVTHNGAWTVTRSVSVSTPQSAIDLGYLAIMLPRRLPQMVLDATRNDRHGASSLLHVPSADQALSLEGDFDRHFRLYAPTGYERDALYVFTPDLMALLIDEAGDLDVEIRDDKLMVYRPGGFDLHDPAIWERFARIRRTIGAKAWNQTDMYQDERAGAPTLALAGPADNTVAPQGARLRGSFVRGSLLHTVPWWLWAILGVAAVCALGGAALAIAAAVGLLI